MPVKNSDDEIVAVAQVINKSNGEGFTKEDEKVDQSYNIHLIDTNDEN
jgi:hypothetical protein